MAKPKTTAKTTKPTAAVAKAQDKNTPAPRASKPKAEETVDDMADLEALIAGEEEIIKKFDDDTDGALIVSDAVEATVNKDEIYAKQKSDEAKGKSTRKTRAAKASGDTPKAPRASRTLTAAMLSDFHADPQALLDSIDQLPKKVQDKARNALHAAVNGGNASVYTQKAIDMMKNATGGVITSKDLKSRLEQDGYTSGTAAAQAQQQMVLLDFLGIAKRNRNELALVTNSPVLKALQKTDAKDDLKLAA